MKPVRKQIFTIPNILSFFRIALIPLIVWMYVDEKPIAAAILLFISGVTDMADGYVARHFNMVSDIGKALDPIADKLTQFVMLVCLVFRFPMMLIPCGLLFVKEIVSGILSLWVIEKTKEVRGADWHGKVTTVLLYATMLLHVLWPGISAVVSYGTIAASTAMMALSFVLYAARGITAVKNEKHKAEG